VHTACITDIRETGMTKIAGIGSRTHVVGDVERNVQYPACIMWRTLGCASHFMLFSVVTPP
jgi:hypothetical protein